MSLNNIYTGGILRVVDKATSLGVTFPYEIWNPGLTPISPLDCTNARLYKTKIGQAIMDHIEDPSVRYVLRMIQSKTSPPDWHHIVYFGENHIVCPEDDVECVRSLDKAILRVEELFEREDRYEFDKVHTENGIYYREANKDVALISKIHFQDQADDSELAKAIKILRKGSTGISKLELHSIFSNYFRCPTNQSLIDDKPTYARGNYIPYPSLNNQAHAMKNALSSLDLKVSLGHAQELIASFYNFASWNHIVALENKCSTPVDPVVISDYRAAPTNHHFYSCMTSAMPAFRKLVNTDYSIGVSVNGTYNKIDIRQSLELGYDIYENIHNDGIRCFTVPQLDRYEIDDWTNRVGL
ncbi:hypothetical protein [Teredinibacter purpureus]|uniref:hypothetical protein n=1 Tax=Teredinibacter purpureus TaxID=2731756 RepID=UPI0005F7A106|nr:hypothetical protein [Teredinibacter purpureus]